MISCGARLAPFDITVPAYAQSSEPQPETVPSPAETEAEPETQNPFTTDGTGTVVDNATDEDGKEFYTITTADESVFYLVIDKQKTSVSAPVIKCKKTPRKKCRFVAERRKKR